MEIVVPGHRYALKNLEEGGVEQTVQFIQKEPVEAGSTQLQTVENGTTNEEVVAMLLDRMEYLQGMLPCQENQDIIEHLHQVEALIKQRADNRKARGISGTLEA